MKDENILCLLLPPVLVVVFLVCGLLVGCETGYTNGTSGGGLGGSFTGLYTSPTGGVMAAASSGNPVTFLNLTQSALQLSAVDSNGLSYQGTLSAVNTTSATFTLQGGTVTITGSLVASGSLGTLTGTYIESSTSSTIYGTAAITAFSTNTSTNAVAYIRWNRLLVTGLWSGPTYRRGLLVGITGRSTTPAKS